MEHSFAQLLGQLIENFFFDEIDQLEPVAESLVGIENPPRILLQLFVFLLLYSHGEDYHWWTQTQISDEFVFALFHKF